jgi:uncharacterized membrane protein
MNYLALLLERHPLVFFHLVCAVGSLVLGAVQLLRRKGTGSHRVLGYTWVVLMGSTAISSAFIRDYGMPNLAGFTPIHFFTVLVAFMLPRGIWYIRRGNVTGHRKTMRGLYLGACVVAGVFTLLPSRFLGQLLWKHALGVVS